MILKMNFKRIIIALGIAAAVISCKKDEEETITPSLNGYLIIENLPEFAAPGDKCSLTVKGVSHPEGGEIRYYWKVLPSKPTADTTETFNFTFTDTLQTVTVQCYAFAEGYSGTSITAYATVVKGGTDGSIKGLEFPTDKITIDGTDYFYKQIGTQTWTLNNMARKTSGKGYRDYDIMSDILGRYYNYNEAVAVCESLGSEWKLPALEDWNILSSYISTEIKNDNSYAASTAAALMGNATFNGTLMWEYWPSVGQITNKSGFSAISAGYANLSSNSFTGTYEYASFWTSTSVENNDNSAYYTYIICDEPELFTGKGDKTSFGASVRCIKKLTI